jgi:hypothetical protein
MATSTLDNIDPFEPDALDLAVDAYGEEVPLMAQIGIGMTPAGLAVDAAEIAKYGRDAYRGIQSGNYGDAAMGAGLTALGIAGLIPVAGDILKAGGKTLLKQFPSKKSEIIKQEQKLTEAARKMQPTVNNPVSQPQVQDFGGDKLFKKIETDFKIPQTDLVNSDQLIERAIKSNPNFQKEIQQISDNLNLEKTPSFKIENGNVVNIEIKTKKSVDSKLERKPYGVSGITDPIRTRIFVNTADDADEVARQVAEKFPTIDSKLQVHPDNGYFDRKLNVQYKNPNDGKTILAEVSMTTKPMADAVDKAHKLYERERDLLKGLDKNSLPKSIRREVNSLQQQQKQAYQKAQQESHPSIIESLIPKYKNGGYVSGRFGRLSPMTPNLRSKSSFESFTPSSQKSIIWGPEAATHELPSSERKNGFANSPDTPTKAGPFSQAKKSVISINEYLLNPEKNAINNVYYVNLDD